MAEASQQVTSISFRGVQMLAADANGYPTVESATEYAGIRIIGAKALTLNIPEWPRITNTGDDDVLAQFVLPAQEGVSGELRVGAMDMIAEAQATGLTIKTVAEAQMLPFATDKLSLPDQWLVGWREAKSVASGDEGRAHYEFVILKAKLAPLAGEWGERASGERRFSITAQVVGKWPWGEALTDAVEGCTKMQLYFGASEYIPRLSAFEGDGTTTEFTITRTSVSTDKQAVYDDGSEATGVTKAVGSLTYAVAPADGTKIVLWSEVEP